MATKLERSRHKLSALLAYFKKYPNHYKFTQDEALSELVQIVQYMLFLIDEWGMNLSNKNDVYEKGD